MTIETTTGTSVPFLSNQRLDEPAVAAIQADGQETLVRTLGALLGFNLTAIGGLPVGCLQAPSTSYSTTTKVLTFTTGGAFTETGVTAEGSNPGARVFRYVPSAAGQVGGLSLASFAASNATCLLWARRYTQAADPAAVIIWDNNQEVTTTGPTLTNELCAFTATSCVVSGATITSFSTPAAPSEGAWVPFAFVSTWTGVAPNGTPTVRPISLWDGTDDAQFVGSTTTNVLAEAAAGSSFGLWAMLRYIRLGLAYITAQDGSVNWATQGIGHTYRGLKELDADLTAVESIVSTIQKRVVLGAALYGFNGADYIRYDYPGGPAVAVSNDVLPASFTPVGAGDYRIALSGIPVGWTVKYASATTADNARCFGFAYDATHVQVNIVSNAAGSTPYNPTYFQVEVIGFIDP